jgi:NitT/TauT family transport system substrate-binding protein
MNLPAGVKVVSWDAEYGGVCPSINGLRPEYIAKYPSVPQKLLAVQAEAREAIAKNPQLAIDALQRNLQISPAVAKSSMKSTAAAGCRRLSSSSIRIRPGRL